MIIWNYICEKSEEGKTERAYGQFIEVAGKNMAIDIKGEENKTTILLLPGWGSPSPILEFLLLAEQLSEKYRVITIEPFVYGLSDEIKTKRDINSIVEELHECMEKLEFVGIDSSVPKL